MPRPDLPEPAGAGSLDELVDRLRRLKTGAGDPSYETIKERVNEAWSRSGRPAAELARRSTVAHAFQPGRRRMNTELVLAVVRALHPDEAYVNRWRLALRVVAGEIEAVSQVRVHDTLPPDLPGFTGRHSELDRLSAARTGGGVVVAAIEGMAGVGKTQLAVHAAHQLHRREPFDRVLFVDLRGFHPDDSQPPADPSAVLDGFLRLLGVPGNRMPHGLDALSAAYREHLTGVRALIVLDNAATAEQVRPLLPDTPGNVVLITSRRRLTGLPPVIRLPLGVFTADEAAGFLTSAVPGVPVGADPQAAAVIARRCGHLPLALSLMAGHIGDSPGWTLTDHADRLGERHRDRRLDSGVEVALALSYRHLSPATQRALRLIALHPGPDLDAYAVAALARADLPTARAWLEQLGADHLILEAAPGRYTLHDLVRAHAATRAQDQDPPAERHAALTRLFDYYLAAGAAAMRSLHPAEARSEDVTAPTPAPDLTGPGSALAWLDAERPTLVAVAAHTAAHGWPTHTTRLARQLSRYFGGGHHHDALVVHDHARRAACQLGDIEAQAHALDGLGAAHLHQGRPDEAAQNFRRALDLFRQLGDLTGQSRVLCQLSLLEEHSGGRPAPTDQT
ncbi:NB-ARC domain-containing protein [Paractinoplanes hotanensis]|uniref:NB-ARC domain-containing protein n=1 Tax=Paractinoplanes hotanensis TaxID=2906497 RepID=A0ABT0XZH9_9ACTN|nr:NB-ARC domain-containing protein [Actinoplanes hotanensis]MCM4078602.1 NB-ARC domain-containing protein [Actinoplanes hotanensis]